MGGTTHLPARQEVSFPKTNYKFQLYQNQNLSWLLATNWKGQKQICSQSNCPQIILNSIYAHLNNLLKEGTEKCLQVLSLPLVYSTEVCWLRLPIGQNHSELMTSYNFCGLLHWPQLVSLPHLPPCQGFVHVLIMAMWPKRAPLPLYHTPPSENQSSIQELVPFPHGCQTNLC